ncbi:MAG: hypothetical protein DRJ01_13995 [Bacteroidetes bacterium]|nr:MAG: hypothetical protein DRJ01_13995 [Bacteroidota bacterium]
MKKKQLIFGVILVIIYLISGCSSKEGRKLTGKVTNAENLPVKYAGIVISYYSESIAKYPNNSSTINFRYPVYYPSNVRMWISHHNKDDVVKFLSEGIVTMVGSSSVSWDTKNEQGEFVVNGIYDLHVKFSIGDDVKNTLIVPTALLRDEYSTGNNNFTKYKYLAYTDENGYFNIDTNTLPMFKKYEKMYVYGKSINDFRLSDHVRIWALHSDYSPTFEDMVLINKKRPTEVFLKFQ